MSWFISSVLFTLKLLLWINSVINLWNVCLVISYRITQNVKNGWWNTLLFRSCIINCEKNNIQPDPIEFVPKTKYSEKHGTFMQFVKMHCWLFKKSPVKQFIWILDISLAFQMLRTCVIFSINFYPIKCLLIVVRTIFHSSIRYQVPVICIKNNKIPCDCSFDDKTTKTR